MENPQFHEAFGFDVDPEGIKQRVVAALREEQRELLDERTLYLGAYNSRRSVLSALRLNEINAKLQNIGHQLDLLNGETDSADPPES